MWFFNVPLKILLIDSNHKLYVREERNSFCSASRELPTPVLSLHSHGSRSKERPQEAKDLWWMQQYAKLNTSRLFEIEVVVLLSPSVISIGPACVCVRVCASWKLGYLKVTKPRKHNVVQAQWYFAKCSRPHFHRLATLSQRGYQLPWSRYTCPMLCDSSGGPITYS